MSLPTLFAVCTPREDVLRGNLTESDFAADLAQVLRGEAPEEYRDAVRFFANTHPTRGLKTLLENVCLRLSGSSEQVAAVFRLDTNFGGGKTHALIALAHAAQGMPGVADPDEFLRPDLVLKMAEAPVAIAAFDGENADPANGRVMGDAGGETIRAFTPWGELAFALAGAAGYETLRKSDESGVAPGAETIRNLFQGPTLILIDEPAIYLRKAAAKNASAGEQLSAFLSVLIKAVESSPRAALVFTLALGKEGRDGKSGDAYGAENRKLAALMQELESVSARKATLLDPTEEDETVQVLCRRLFQSIDRAGAEAIVAEYRRVWEANRDHLPAAELAPVTGEAFLAGFPFHPDLIAVLKEKTSTLGNFQRVRGMLRLLARTVGWLWSKRPAETYAVHLHHIDLSSSPIRQEILTKLGQQAYAPALAADITAVAGDQPALAERLDQAHFSGLPPYATFTARCIFFHSLAFNEALQGATENEIRFTLLGPGMEIGFIDKARRLFVQESDYLDDRPHRPLRFQVEPNLTQMIRRHEAAIDPGTVRDSLNTAIRDVFKGTVFQPVFFPALAIDLKDEATERPLLAVLGYEATAVSAADARIEPPELVVKLFRHKSDDATTRLNRNNLVFVAADANQTNKMQENMGHLLALEKMTRSPAVLQELAPHQKDKLRELAAKARQEAAIAIQQAYRHIFYPAKRQTAGPALDLAHAVIEYTEASAKPGDGQEQVRQVLRGIVGGKLRQDGDQPDSPDYLIARTPLSKQGHMTTQALRNEFFRDPGLPMLAGKNIFFSFIRVGIEQGALVYRNGDLICGKGDPYPTIIVDEQAEVMTAAYARENKIWPKEIGGGQAGQTGGGGQGGQTGGGGQGGQTGGGGQGGQTGGGGQGGQTGEPLPPITEEGLLKEALIRVWEKARKEEYAAIASLQLTVSEIQDGLVLLGPVGLLQGCDKRVKLDANYETTDKSTCSLKYEGSLVGLQPLKEFLPPQLRAAANKYGDICFDLTFPKGLSLAGEAPETLTEKLTKTGGISAYVKAVATRHEQQGEQGDTNP